MDNLVEVDEEKIRNNEIFIEQYNIIGTCTTMYLITIL